MKTIKFSHRYTKHPNKVRDGSEVILLEVLNSKFEELSDTFIEYDTKNFSGENYKLPKKGDCLVLLFLGAGVIWDTGELFTTVRRSTPAKEMYYKGLRGQKLVAKIEFDRVD
ncbi:MAG: hypothetical protein KAQ85_00265 [Thermodesulfovibrionia bacterium]|nr:hypothetical protein [Thermodesulfovibrionia bacterium]